MDATTIGTLVLAGLYALNHIKDVIVALRSKQSPAAVIQPQINAAVTQLLAAAKGGKLDPSHPLVSALEILMAVK